MRGLGLRALRLVAVASLVAGCGIVQGAGSATTQDRDVGDDVTAVELRTSGDLRVEVGDDPGLTVTAGENVVDDLTSEVEDGTLVLSTDRSFVRWGDVEYSLVVTRLTDLVVTGSGSVDVGALRGESLAVEISGSGDVSAEDVDLDDLSVGISGSGSVRTGGRAESQEVGISGSGSYDGTDLASARARVTVSGSGGAEVDVSDELEATVSGSGDVVYTGDPAVRASTSGSGDVRAR